MSACSCKLIILFSYPFLTSLLTTNLLSACLCSLRLCRLTEGCAASPKAVLPHQSCVASPCLTKGGVISPKAALPQFASPKAVLPHQRLCCFTKDCVASPKAALPHQRLRCLTKGCVASANTRHASSASAPSLHAAIFSRTTASPKAVLPHQ